MVLVKEEKKDNDFNVSIIFLIQTRVSFFTSTTSITNITNKTKQIEATLLNERTYMNEGCTDLDIFEYNGSSSR